MTVFIAFGEYAMLINIYVMDDNKSLFKCKLNTEPCRRYLPKDTESIRPFH